MVEDDKKLDELFRSARQDRDDLPVDLTKRIVSDALEIQRKRSAREGRRKQPILILIAEALGGWPGIGGLATACAAGVWIGLAPPVFLPDPVELFVVGGEADLMAEFGLSDLATEEE